MILNPRGEERGVEVFRIQQTLRTRISNHEARAGTGRPHPRRKSLFERLADVSQDAVDVSEVRECRVAASPRSIAARRCNAPSRMLAASRAATVSITYSSFAPECPRP